MFFSKENIKILVVEDEANNIQYFKEIFEFEKINCIFSETGLNAINILNDNPDIDIILVDIKLPDINGLELTKSIKKQMKNIPIIAQTAYAMPGDKEKCINAGCDDYIEKPIDRVVLIQKILKLI